MNSILIEYVCQVSHCLDDIKLNLGYMFMKNHRKHYTVI
jgi:hypothetical protein